MAPRLSENKVDDNYTGARSSDSSDFTYYNLVATVTIVRYSTSMEERAIVRCFVEL